MSAVGSPWPSSRTSMRPPSAASELASVTPGLVPSGAALRRLLLQRHLGPEVVEIPGDRGDRQHAAIALEPQEAVLAGDVPLDGELVPLFGVADVADGNVIMLAPEERDSGKSLPLPDHVERRRLALPFRNDPVLDSKGLAEASIGPAGDVPGGEYPRAACFEKRVHRHAALDRQAGPFGQLGTRPHADADHHEIRLERR